MADSNVYFGYQTALQILRAVDSSRRGVARYDDRKLPERALGGEALAGIIERLCAMHPGLHIDLPVHVLVGGDAHRRLSRDCAEHVFSASLSGMPFYRLDKGVYVAAPHLAFTNIASAEKSRVALQELAYELCGTYQTRRTGVASAYDVSPLSSVQSLRDFASANSALRGARKAGRALRHVANGSASARETKLALVSALPYAQGGYNMGVPHMNYEVEASPAARAITGKSFFRCDLCWPDAKVAMEYQSRESHSGEASRIGDSRRANALASMGWTIVEVTNDELDSLAAMDTIAETVCRHQGRCLRPRISDYRARKLKLRRQLALPVRRGW